MNIDINIMEFGRVCRVSRAEEELHFLTALLEDTAASWKTIAKYIPNPITVKTILESFPELGKDKDYHRSLKAQYRDEEIAKQLIIPQVKKMSLLPKTKKELFMLYPALIRYFGSIENYGWMDMASKPAIKMSYSAMMTILKDSDWEGGIGVNDQVKASPVLNWHKITFDADEQADIINTLYPICRFQGEASMLNLARLLVDRGIIGDDAIASYRGQLEKRKQRCSSNHDGRDSIVYSDSTLKALTLARISKIGSVEVYDAYFAK